MQDAYSRQPGGSSLLMPKEAQHKFADSYMTGGLSRAATGLAQGLVWHEAEDMWQLVTAMSVDQIFGIAAMFVASIMQLAVS